MALLIVVAVDAISSKCVFHKVQCKLAPKKTFKQMVKKLVIDHWEHKLRQESESLDSLAYFHPQFMSLTKSHKII